MGMANGLLYKILVPKTLIGMNPHRHCDLPNGALMSRPRNKFLVQPITIYDHTHQTDFCMFNKP